MPGHGYSFAFSRRWSPEVCIFVSLLENRGRREDRVLAAPAVPRAICANKTAHEHTGQLEHSGLPCAMALRLTSCSSRRTALLPPSPALLIASLTPAPRRPNHTTSPYAQAAHVSRSSRVHRISPRVVTMANAPQSGETGGVMRLIWVDAKAEYFRFPGLTRFLKIRSDLPVVPVCRGST
jgi:hypothetical protein